MGGSLQETTKANPFVYAANDPVNEVDPSGQYTISGSFKAWQWTITYQWYGWDVQLNEAATQALEGGGGIAAAIGGPVGAVIGGSIAGIALIEDSLCGNKGVIVTSSLGNLSISPVGC